MPDIFLYNSLTRKKEKLTTIKKGEVSLYTCGPTVYDYATVGNFRTYVTSDILARVLGFNSLDVKYVMNLTDVGHLTGDNLGDADLGEDRIEKAAKDEGKNAWDISNFYIKEFMNDIEKINVRVPWQMPKATDHIKEQINLVARLEKKGFTYKTQDGVYFDTKKYEEKTKKKYGALSTLDKRKEGARVKKNPEKRDIRDFALWKFSKKKGERHMEWDSPWGLGFPGWHIECSAMSMKYLGESFDIHVGGEDLRSTHHPNEIAQAEGATGKQFVNYWVHVTHLKVEGKRMGKSLGNAYTLEDVEKKGYDPLALRYLYLTAHYRDSLNFTWKGLKSAQTALKKLREQVMSLSMSKTRTTLSSEKSEKVQKFNQEFVEAVNSDLNMPKALSVIWKIVKSNIPDLDKYDLILSFDEVLGLGLRNLSKFEVKVPEKVSKLVEKREQLRSQNRFDEADSVRKKIKELGFVLEDTPKGPRLKKDPEILN